MIYTREEDIISMSKRHPGVAYYKLGVAEDGRITAIKVKYILNGGAYATLSPVVLWRGTVHAGGPYKCDNVHIETYAARTNTVPNGAYRGFGTPQILFAVEQQIDRAAEKLGISPAKIREINGLKVGDETITGHKLRNSTGYINTLKKVVEESNFDQVFDFENYKKQEGPIVRGIGIGSLIYGVGLGAGGKKLARAGAFVEVLGDGSAVFAVGTTEMGQGEITVLSQITADALGIKYEKVRMLDVDTTRVPDSGPTVASRATVMSGNAIIDAATKIKKRIFMVAAEMLGIEEVDVEADDGVIFSKTDPNKKLTYEEVVQECMLRRVHLAEQGWYIAPHTSFNEKNGQGDAYFTYTFATNVAEVAVDIETGEIRVEKLYSAYDIKPVNPQQVEGQIEGGTTQAMGYALYENMVLDGGKILTNTFSTYTIPTVKEMPEIKSYTVPAEFPDGPFGAKGFGETPMMAVAPAIANAIYNATGVRITRLPITPELFLKKLKEARETK